MWGILGIKIYYVKWDMAKGNLLLRLWLLVTIPRSLKNVEILWISFKLLTGEHFSSPQVYNHENKEL